MTPFSGNGERTDNVGRALTVVTTSLPWTEAPDITPVAVMVTFVPMVVGTVRSIAPNEPVWLVDESPLGMYTVVALRSPAEVERAIWICGDPGGATAGLP